MGERCKRCNGTGKCPRCDGTGREKYGLFGLGIVSDTCKKCHGSGQCRYCNGTGKVSNDDE